MSFVSILGVGEIKKTASVAQPAFFRDLNLNQVIDKIQEYAGDYLVKKYYYAFPMEEDVIYRQEIYQDIKNRELYERLMEFSSDMRKSAAKEVTETFSGEPLQGDSWQLESAYHYCKAIVELKETLDKGIEQKKYKSQGIQDLREFLEGIMKEKSFLEMSQDVFRIWDMFSNTHFTLEIMGNKVRISPKAQEGVYEDNLNECFKEYGTVEKGSMHSPFIGDVSLTRLERRLLQAFFGKYPQLEREIIKFAEKYQQFKNLQILQLEQELQFYLAYYRFQKEWEGMGAMFSKPNRNEESPMEALGVYDLALACMNYPANKVVVSNDFVYSDEEQFFVVNGPNQGGKTTFARSLGQLVYFYKIGLDVNAKSANLHYFDKLVTHFSVEESMESGHGKLMEELKRLAPIMNEECKNAFVIINELFTTAAHYDGCVMGARVLDFFMKRKCYGVYVTHLRALGDDARGVAHMAATLDGSKEHRRTYKVLRNQTVINGYAKDIVNKYQLTYEALRDRLKGYAMPEGGDGNA